MHSYKLLSYSFYFLLFCLPFDVIFFFSERMHSSNLDAGLSSGFLGHPFVKECHGQNGLRQGVHFIIEVLIKT
jgi:hypothetical protein